MGLLNMWAFEKNDDFLPSERYMQTVLRCAASNMREAEISGQGSRAFLACRETLTNADSANYWSLKIFHELNLLIQRKYLCIKYAQIWELNGIWRILKQQIEFLQPLRERTLTLTTFDGALFNDIAECEKLLCDGLTELIMTEDVVI